MNPKAKKGDTVWIYDHKSDLFIFEGEVIHTEGSQALVMIPLRFKKEYGCVADTFDVDKLKVRKKKSSIKQHKPCIREVDRHETKKRN